MLAASASIQPAQLGSFAFKLRVENSMTEQEALDKAWAEPTGTTSTFTSAVATREERSGTRPPRDPAGRRTRSTARGGGLRSPQSGTIGPLYFDARVVKTCRRAEDGRVEVEVDLARVIRDRMTAGCDSLTIAS